MKRIEIIVNDKAYPCSPTAGAMLRFKEQTGREVTEIDSSSFTDLLTYLWCCVVAASKREDIDFGMSLMDFADNLTPEDMADWSQLIAEPTATSAEGSKKKKSPRASMSS